MYDAGRARLEVVPSFLNVESAISRFSDRLGKRLQTTVDKAVGQGVSRGFSTGDLSKKLAGIKAELADLAKATPTVKVDADTAAAMAQLSAVDALARRLDGTRAEVHVSADRSPIDGIGDAASSSASRLQSLIQAGLALGPALIPAAAAASSAIGFIGQAATSSAAGIGVLALGFSGVGDAVKALQQYSEDADESATALFRSQQQVASASSAVAAAERSLGNVRANNADSLRRADRSVEDAERALARAHNDARRAVLEVTRAREDARRALQDMAFDVEELSIAQRRANLDQAEAKRELDKVLADPDASKEQREQAQLTYDDITLRVKRLGVEQQRLQTDQKAANKAGVEGSRQVVAAQEQVRAKNEAVEQAQRRLSDAVAAQAATQRQAAFAISQAQAAVAAAHRQAEAAAVSAGTAGGAALDKLNEAMENLSPAGQRFARFLFGLRDELKTLRASAAEPLLPGVQRAVENLLPSLPALNRYVSEVAGSLGDMAEGASRFLTTDATWRRFWDYTGDTTVPTLERLARIGRDTTTGLVGLYLAFTPFNDDIGGGLEGLAARFSRWATTLERNPSFERFLAYVEENGPKVVDLIGEITEFTIRYIEAAAPVGSVVVEAFTALVGALNAIPMPVLTALATTITAVSAAMLVARAASIVWAAATAAQARAQVIATAALRAYNAEMAAATIRTGQVGGALTTTTAAMNAVGRAGRGVVSFFGGPWGVALAGAAVAVGVLAKASADYQAKVDGLRVALGDLGDAYGNITRQGRGAAESTEDALNGIIRSNPEIQKTVVTLDALGISFDQLARAAGGSQQDMQAALAALDAEIARLGDRWQSEFLKFWDPGTAKATADRLAELRRMRSALLENADALGTAARAQDIATAAEKRSHDLSQAFANFIGPVTVDVYRQLAAQYDANTSKIAVLQGLVDAFGNAQSTAAQKANALRAAIEEQTGAAVSAIEQDEAWSQALLNLSGSVASNGTTLALNSQEGLRNRDALEAAALATRNMYLEQIAAGKPIADVTKAHQARIDALIKEAQRLGLDEQATRNLIAAYGDVPDKVETAYETKGFEQVYKELQELQFAQFALSKGWTPEQAAKAWRGVQAPAPRAPNLGDGIGVPIAFRDGGGVKGQGTGTSDSNLAWLSRGEFVEPTSTVDYYGAGLFEALRQKAIPKSALPGYRDGGLVMQAPFRIDLSKTFVPTLDEALSKVIPQPSAGGIGSLDMMKILRRPFPGLDLYSGFRRGSRTASGNLSYHAMIAADGDEGRAVDIPPRRDVFNYIHDHFKALTRELIWLGDPDRNIHNGSYHRYSQSLLNQHGTAGMPNAHIHWAMDQGGMLQPGWNPPIWNGTGKPEPVLTNAQWAQISRAARGGGQSPAVNNNFNFRETSLTPGLLRQMQDVEKARAALNRDGRNR